MTRIEWRTISSRTVLLCVLVLAALLALPHIFESGIPTDEGVLGQSAERVLRGEIPHRDFIALWSGGLDIAHAAMFRLFGISFRSMHLLLLVAWLGGLAAMFEAARRLIAPWPAALLVLVAADWTVPKLPHPLPSWYALFLSLAGTAAVVRYLDTRRAGWLVLAGITAGAACAVKITGLYWIAAVALLFVWLVQEESSSTISARQWFRPYMWTISLGLAGYLALVGAIFAGVTSYNAAFHYLLPTAILVGLLLYREWRFLSTDDAERFRRLLALTLPFVFGVLLVLGPWAGYYAVHGALEDLLRGLFVTPRVRFAVTSFPLPGFRSAAVAGAPFLALIAGAIFVRQPLRRIDRIALWLVVAISCALTFDGSPVSLIVWYGVRFITPLSALFGVWWLGTRNPSHAIPRERRAVVFFLVAAAVSCSFIQIPFALYTYFLYFLPLMLLAFAALLSSQPSMPRDVPVGLLIFLLWFGLRNPESLARSGGASSAPRHALLPLSRSGVRVPAEDSALYTNLVTAVTRRSRNEWIYVWHDAPEVYFLAGKRNPTRTLFEVFDPPFEQSTAYLTDRLKRHDVEVVVLTDTAGAARPLPRDFRDWLERVYPRHEQIGRFEVRWRGIASP